MKKKKEFEKTGLEIAVTGMAGRFPQAKNLDQFWDNLKKGSHSVSFLTDEEIEESGIEPGLLKSPDYVRSKGGVLEDAEYFDASFFGFLPGEVQVMDPQTRLFLECSWHALEDAGYEPDAYNGLIGVYAGASSGFQWEARTVLSGLDREVDQFTAMQLRNKDFLSTRVSFHLNLRGPAVTLNTACSTSLVAIDHACRGLLTGICDMALAGGVALSPSKKIGYLYQEGMINSPDGCCRAFDAKAGGTVSGEGVGIAVLKRLDEAIADGDHIYAVIKGFAINNDGLRKAGYTAPSVDGQAEVIRAARQMAEVEFESIGYVETHGTGTPLGDPVEIAALKLAFNSQQRQFCGIGSVKTNIGHLDAAAGIAGFIKTVLMLKHKEIPPSLHFKSPNPKIDFEKSPFYVNARLKAWENDQYPLRAGVSSFGIGGTNAHVILEEAPSAETSRETRPWQLILLSAKTESALDKASENLKEFLIQHPKTSLPDVAYTMQVGRQAFVHRRMLVCSDVHEAIAVLSSPGSEKIRTFHSKTSSPPVIFMFSGQGAQYVNMGWDLYRTEPCFRETMDRCFEILKSLMEFDVKEILYPGEMRNRSQRSNRAYIPNINQTEIAQPLLLAFEYALAKLLIQWGIKPYAMIGHSIGEYTAACLSGVFSLEDALKLVVSRGKLMQQLPHGSMVSVPLPEEELKPLLNEEISLAAVNSPSLCVVSGPHDAIRTFAGQMEEKGYRVRHLHTSHAFHSGMMEPLIHEFKAKVSAVNLNEPGMPYISNVTGEWLAHEQAMDPGYWAHHLRKTVRFARGITELAKIENAIFVEVGPGKALSTFVTQHNNKTQGLFNLNLVRHPKEPVDDNHYLLKKIGQLWLYGKSPDWSQYHAEKKRNRVTLPGYPFEGQRYWIDDDRLKSVGDLLTTSKSVRKKDIADWFYIPSWERSMLTPYQNIHPGSSWLVFLDECGVGAKLVKRLEQENHQVIIVRSGAAFTKVSDNEFIINPAEPGNYNQLFNELEKLKKIPQQVYHLWNITINKDGNSSAEGFEDFQLKGFYSLLSISRAIEKQKLNETFRLVVVSNNIQDITGEEILCPGKATLLGPVNVIPQELPFITCRSIDIALPLKDWQQAKLIDFLLAESTGESTETVIAYRNNYRWIQRFKPVKLKETVESTAILREKGVYLITGGLGTIGLILAEYLARTVRAKLILTGGSVFPVRDKWNQWLVSHSRDDHISSKIMEIQKIQKMGAEIMVFTADTANREQMEKVIASAEQQLGPINGVIHAAGVTRGKSSLCEIRKLTKIECQQQFHPKVYGLLVLEEIFKDRNLDFCLLTSSLSSILGGLGFAVYSAANIFMDAFAREHNRKGPERWISVNWDGWQSEEQKEPGVEILPGEGQTAFHRILASGLETQAAVSTVDLQTRIDQWVKLESLREEDNFPGNEKSLLRPRPNLTTSYAAPRSELEISLVDIWQDFFGIKEIGINDDFFELGGDSLKLMTVAAKIHKKLNVDIPLAECFNRPTIHRLAKFFDHVEKVEKNECYPIKPVEEKEIYPLSSAQKRLFILHQLDKDSVAYNQQQMVFLEGNLDTERLERAFKRFMQRHEILRTSIEMITDEPFQRIQHKADLSFRYFEGEEDQVEGLVNTFSRPFDLAKVPLLRIGVVKVGPMKHVLIIDMHHIVTDGISYHIFVKEVMWFYEKEELPSIMLRYKDYSEWQNSRKQREGMKQQGKYWLEEFAGELPVLSMPTDYERPAQQSFEGDAVGFTLDRQKTNALKKVALNEGTTPYVVLLSVYNVLLSKLSGQEDIIIGTPIAGRKQADLQNIMGLFVNTLALRNYPLGDKTFKQFLHEVREKTIKAFENQDYQFEELIEKLSLKKDMSRNPLCDVFFVYLNLDWEPGAIPGAKIPDLEFKIIGQETRTSKFDMSLDIEESGNQLFFTLTYCKKLFKKEKIQRFSSYYNKILSTILEDNQKKIIDLDIMPHREKRQILYEFNETKSRYILDSPVFHMIEKRAEEVPDSTAFVFQNRTISYIELNEKANELAYILKGKGIKRGKYVPLLMERGFQLPIALLAVMKVGAAFVPMDIQWPINRITEIIKDLNCDIVLVDGNDSHQLHHGETLLVDQDRLSSNLTNLNIPVDLDDPIYVIYTSGSTGKPKGAVNRHLGIANRLLDMNRRYQCNENDVILMTNNHIYDTAIWELFWPLINKAKTVMPAHSRTFDFEEIITLIEKERVTITDFVPSVFNTFVDFIEDRPEFNEKLNSLRQILIGGEEMKAQYIYKFKSFFPGIGITNGYGPTETSIAVVFYELPPEYIEPIPIGKPMPNVYTLILEKNLHPVPLGVPGELYIGGACVGLGYLNDVEKTSKVFITPPIKNFNKGIFYKTGDRTRYLADGTIEFLGRMDYQVKIRGIRIEVGEIECNLLNHQMIDNALVVAKEDRKGNKYLAAYLLCREEVNVMELREYLGIRLPEYMIPAYFVILDEFPLTPNGKIHRNRLPEPEGINLGRDIEYAAPGNDIEKTLVEIWEKILGKSSIGINENFFMIGGDSIKTIQVASRMYKSGYRVEMRDLFRYPTIAQLAPYVKKAARIADQSVVTGTFPLTPIQRGFFLSNQTDKHHYNQSVMLYFNGRLESEALTAMFLEIQQHHDALRLGFRVETNGTVTQMNHGLDYPFSLQVHDFCGMENPFEMLEIKANEIQAGIDLQQGPLMKLGLFHLDDGDRLLIVVHHLAIDGVSWRILFEDIEQLFQQYKKREKLELPLKTDSFKVWSEKLSAYANSQSFLKEKTYWAALDSTGVSKIKKDFNHNSNLIKDMASLSFSLGHKETELLLTQVNKAFGTEINDILLTGLGLSIRDLFKVDKVLIALEGHGREEILKDVNINRTVGWFTIEYPVILDIFGEDDLARQIKEIKHTLHSVPNKGVGYGILEHLTPEESKKEMDFKLTPQISFNYLGQFDTDVKQMSFEISQQSPGNEFSMKTRRKYELEIAGVVANGLLTISILYNKKQYKTGTIKGLLNCYKEKLVETIVYCSNRDKREKTPTDFTYKELSIEYFDRLKKQFTIEIADLYLLAPMQEGMLFHSLYSKNSTIYFAQKSYRMQGDLNLFYFEKSLNELINRYDILRTAFVYKGLERSLQVVLETRKIDFHYEDLSGIKDEEEKEKIIKEYKETDKKHTFDLSKDVLIRAAVLRLDESRYEFIWSHHHILMDGWCVAILNAEFFEIYASYLENRAYRLAQVSPYRTYIEWLETQDKQYSMCYWKNYLHGYKEIAAISNRETPHSNHGNYRNEKVILTLSRDVNDQLNGLRERFAVTLNTVIQSVWGIFLGKHCGKQDVVFGAVVSGRPAQIDGIESMIGLFINTIPVRIQWDGKIKFRELLFKAREDAIGCKPHHYFPLAEIQNESRLKQNLLDHILVFENYPEPEEITGIRDTGDSIGLKILNIESFEHGNYDFNVIIIPGKQLVIEFCYNANAFEKSYVKEIADSFNRILSQVIHNEEIRIDQLSLLSEEEMIGIDSFLKDDIKGININVEFNI